MGAKQNSSSKRSSSAEWEQISKQLARTHMQAKGAWNNQRGMSVRVRKGIGPNRASGHKGGMGRQGSKRG